MAYRVAYVLEKPMCIGNTNARSIKVFANRVAFRETTLDFGQKVAATGLSELEAALFMAHTPELYLVTQAIEHCSDAIGIVDTYHFQYSLHMAVERILYNRRFLIDHEAEPVDNDFEKFAVGSFDSERNLLLRRAIELCTDPSGKIDVIIYGKDLKDFIKSHRLMTKL
jgi:hypothetical protein